MNPQPNLTSSQAPAKVDFLRNIRQYDEPTLVLVPWKDVCEPYQIWRKWMMGALVGGRQLLQSLRESAIAAYWASANNSDRPPSWPFAALIEIDQLSIQAKEFLLATNAGVYLCVALERRATAAAGGRA